MIPALNCAQIDEHPAHEWEGVPLPARASKFWCDFADPHADKRLAREAAEQLRLPSTIEAHRHAAAACRQAAEAGDGLHDDEAEHEKIAAGLRSMADQHDREAARLTRKLRTAEVAP